MAPKKTRSAKKAKYEPPPMLPVQQDIETVQTHVISADGTISHPKYISLFHEQGASSLAVPGSTPGSSNPGSFPPSIGAPLQGLGTNLDFSSDSTWPNLAEAKPEEKNTEQKAKVNNTIVSSMAY